jgi:CHAD domain-containing protein
MKKLTTYIKEQRVRINDLLSDLNGTPVSDNLHKLRVEIKKLRAVIDVLNQKYPSKKVKKACAALRLLFKQSGQIREKEVQASLFTSFGLPVPDDWNKSMPKLEVILYIPDLDKMYKKLIKISSGISKNAVLEHIASKDMEWKRMLHENGIHCDFHEARKLVKIVIYLQPCVDKKYRIDGSRYKKMQDLMGEWNDRDELIKICEAHNYYVDQLTALKQSRDDLAGQIVQHFKEISLL